VRDLLHYVRLGLLKLSQINLPWLTSKTLQFVEHQTMFRQIALQNCVPLDLPSISADANSSRRS
jgi:hypothetical protein